MRTGAGHITLQEQRLVEGLDRDVPTILSDGVVYDLDVDRFMLDLPLNGVRSRHSLRAYGYDVMVWVRFLETARGKSIWSADHNDLLAFHRARRREDAEQRISAASWNRAVAALEKLYRWGEGQGLVATSPFTHREVWRRSHGAGRSRLALRNDAYERAAKRSDLRFISLEDFRVFRDVGLRGLAPDGAQRSGARDRNGSRNALFAELLVTSGLRLEEASFLLKFELPAATTTAPQVWCALPQALTKGDRGRSILIPTRLLEQLLAYARLERATAVAKFQGRAGWNSFDRPIFILDPRPAATSVTLRDGGHARLERLTPQERGRLVICDATGTPVEPAALWLTEVGQPVQPNSWEAVFARASRRCTTTGFPIRVNPHQLRHSFAVHMLAMLIERRIQDAAMKSNSDVDGYRQLLGDPLQQVQRLLGHASLATTYIYLDHAVTRADTIDVAVDELLSLITGPAA